MEKQTQRKSVKEMASELFYLGLEKIGVYFLNTPEKRNHFKILYSKRLETNSKGELVDRFYLPGFSDCSPSLKEIVKDKLYIAA